MLTSRLILEKFDKDLRLLERRERPSRSFLLQFIELLYLGHAHVVNGAPYSMTDITNTARDVDGEAGSWVGFRKANLQIASLGGAAAQAMIAGTVESAAQDTIQNVEILGENIGIVVGTGVAAVTPADYALGTKIAHGSGAGELEHGGTELLSIAFVDPNGQFTIRRYFTNNSGGGITVEEVGIYACGTHYVPNDMGFAYPFCAARDLTGGVAVANTELLRVTYVVQITV